MRGVPGPRFYPDIAGSVSRSTADVVTSAPELARLTLNVAAVHHDSRTRRDEDSQRLVYGGHMIGLALSQAVRLLPNLAAVLAGITASTVARCMKGHSLQRSARRGS